MRTLPLILLPLAIALFTAVRGQTNTADAYFSTESPVAKANLLANIGPSGSKSQGAKAGVVIASPSTSNPNYLFTWIRDSSLVFQTLIDQCVDLRDLNRTVDSHVLDSRLGSILHCILKLIIS